MLGGLASNRWNLGPQSPSRMRSRHGGLAGTLREKNWLSIASKSLYHPKKYKAGQQATGLDWGYLRRKLPHGCGEQGGSIN